MISFEESNMLTDLDFLAFSVARMELDTSCKTIHSSRLNMPDDMQQIFLLRLEHYRKIIIDESKK